MEKIACTHCKKEAFLEGRIVSEDGWILINTGMANGSKKLWFCCEEHKRQWLKSGIVFDECFGSKKRYRL